MATAEAELREVGLSFPQVARHVEQRVELWPRSALRYAWLPPAYRGTDPRRAGIVTEYPRCGYDFLSVGELLVFTDIEYYVLDRERDAGGGPPTGDYSVSRGGGRSGPPIMKPERKDAQVIYEDLNAAYGQEWGLTFFSILTGMGNTSEHALSVEDGVRQAYEIFSTICPYSYTLAGLQQELGQKARERIEERFGRDPRRVPEPYFEYPDAPTPDRRPARRVRELRIAEAAERVRMEMLVGLDTALARRDRVLAETTRLMAERAGTGVGKVTPDPLDLYLYEQSGMPAPVGIRSPHASPVADEDTKQLVKMMAERMLMEQKSSPDPGTETMEQMLAHINEQRAELDRLRAEIDSIVDVTKGNPRGRRKEGD